MAFDRLPLPVRQGLYLLAVAILLYLCLAPSSGLPEVDLWDKGEHAIAWAVLALSGVLLFPRQWRAVVIFALALGALVEVLQGVMPLGRDADWRDWVADAIGVAVATAGFLIVRRVRR